MKKLLAFALILTVIGLVAGCKKSEDKPAQDTKQAQSNTPEPKQAQPFKPRNKKNKGGKNKAAAALELYNESTLLTSVPKEQYKTMTDQKIKIKDKEFQAILLKDLLKKYKMQGKNVILTGGQNSATLTWAQANASNIYVYVTPKGDLKLYSPTGDTESGLPKRLVKLTTSATTEAAQTAPAKSNKTGQTDKTTS